ncbi:hypothetical protein IAD21_02265 [Abditibacteriota bacterium]|nr:hypothetical protein IAD21_02265 [Abditibacteriota bacterium]
MGQLSEKFHYQYSDNISKLVAFVKNVIAQFVGDNAGVEEMHAAILAQPSQLATLFLHDRNVAAKTRFQK